MNKTRPQAKHVLTLKNLHETNLLLQNNKG